MIREISIFIGKITSWHLMLATAYLTFSNDTENAIYVLLWAILLQLQVNGLEHDRNNE